MELDDVISFLKKKGFKDTFYVLTKFKNNKTDKHTFYDELNKFSYYNSFFRVKEDLLDKGLIEIKNHNNMKTIGLTKKGENIYAKLMEINQLINTKNT